MPDPSRQIYNSGIQVLNDAGAKAAEIERAKAGATLKRSVSENSGAPAVQVFPVRDGVYVIMTWHDGNATYLKVTLPISNKGSFPGYQDFSSVETQSADIAVKFAALSAEEYATQVQKRPAAAMFKVLVSHTPEPDKTIEMFRVMRLKGVYTIEHRNISAQPPKPQVDKKSTLQEVDDDISGIVLPELPPLKPGEDPFEFKDEDDD